MKEQLKEALRKQCGKHFDAKRTARRTGAFVLALAMMGSLLTGPTRSIAFAEETEGDASVSSGWGVEEDTDFGKTHCGYKEHEHTDECYTKKLICGYTEGQPEDPTATRWPDTEDGTQGGLDMDFDVDSEEEPDSSLDDAYALMTLTDDGSGETTGGETTGGETGHKHTESCYKKVLTCGKIEHTHTVSCLADRNADLEDSTDWEKYLTSKSNWAEALVEVADSQAGYTQSKTNFEVDEEDDKKLDELDKDSLDNIKKHFYTRYGQWAGAPYADNWDLLFTSFCQRYAGIPESVIPRVRDDTTTVDQWESQLNQADDLEGCVLDETTDPKKEGAIGAGDLIVYTNSEGKKTTGIVVEGDEDTKTLTVVSGNVDGKVAEVTVERSTISTAVQVGKAYRKNMGTTDVEPDEDKDIDIGLPGEDMPVERDERGIDFKPFSKSETLEWRRNNNDTWKALDQNSGSLEQSYQLRVTLEYELPKGTLQQMSKDEAAYDTIYYVLPDALEFFTSSGDVDDANGNHVGTYSIAGGIVSVKFYSDYVQKNAEGEIKGNVVFTGSASQLKYNDEGKVEISFREEDNWEVTVKPKPVELTPEKTGEVDLANSKIKYTLTVTAKTTTYNSTVRVVDTLSGNNATYTSEDINLSVLKKTKDDPEGKTLPPKNQDSENGWALAYNDSQKFDLTLPAMEEGDSYVITYYASIDRNAQLSSGFKVKNTAVTFVTVGDSTSQWTKTTENLVNGLIEKTYLGTTNHQMNWQVVLNKNEDNLQLCTLADVLNGVEFTGKAHFVGMKDGVKVSEFNANLPYTFDMGNRDYVTAVYTVTYSTPDSAGSNGSVTNRAYQLKPGQTITDKNTLFSTVIRNPNQSDIYQKQGTGVDENDNGTLTLHWNISLNPQYDRVAGWTLKDTPQAGQYLTPEQQQELENALKTALNDAGITDYTLTHTENADGNWTGFTVTGNSMWKARQKVTFQYSTTRAMEGVTGNYEYTNTIRFDNYTTTGINYYHEGTVVKKVDVSDGLAETGEVTKHEYHEVNGTLKWDIVVTLTDKMKQQENFTIEDELPEGVTLTRLSLRSDDGYFSNTHSTTPPADKSEWKWSVGYAEMTTKVDGQTVTVTVPARIWNDTSKNGLRNKTVTLTVEGTIQPSAHDTTMKYPNHVTVRSDGLTTPSEAKQEQDIFFNENHNAVSKTGGLVQGASNQVQYRIDVNPDGKQYLDGKTRLTLTDTLTYPYNNTAILLMDEKIHVYHRNADGTKGDELTAEEYAYTYTEGERENGKQAQNVLTFYLPDKTPLIVEYVYRGKGGTPGTSFVLQNNAVLQGTSSQGSSSGNGYSFSVQNSSASATVSGIGIYKVDADNYAKALPGAVFKLEKWEGSDWEVIQKTVTSGADGKLAFDGTLMNNVAYRLTETKAPEGYQLAKEPLEFYLSAPGVLSAPSDFKGVAYEVGQKVFFPDAEIPKVPSTPLTPATPVKPDKPDQPDTPDTPSKPDQPDKPDTPDTPSTPSTPDTPSKPDTPTTPDEPDTPSTPTTPEKPDVPATPLTPAIPVVPQTPYEPDQPDTPDQPADSETPASSEPPAGSDSTETRASSTTTGEPEQPAASVLPETPADSVNPGAPGPDNQDGWVMGAHGSAESPASSVSPRAPGPDSKNGWVLGAHGLIQTGQLNWPIPVLAALGGGLLLLGIYLNRKSRRHKDE